MKINGIDSLIVPVSVMMAEIGSLEDANMSITGVTSTPVIQTAELTVSSLDLHRYVGGVDFMWLMVKNLFIYATKYGNSV